MARNRRAVDPECPTWASWVDEFITDPLTGECGCEDEIIEAQADRHWNDCKRCQRYGSSIDSVRSTQEV